MTAFQHCEHSKHAAAYLQGELQGPERRRFGEHLEGCYFCQEELDGLREMLSALEGDRRQAESVAAAGGPLRPMRLHLPGIARRGALPGWYGIAALTLLGITLVIIFYAMGLGVGGRSGDGRPGDATAGNVALAETQALSWMANAQEPGGLWSAARWGGDSRFDVGLTGLGLLTYLESAAKNASLPRPAQRARQALLELQRPDGMIGPDFFASPYNHSIATLSLLEAHGIECGGSAAAGAASRTLSEPVRKAIAWIIRAQSQAGGWGYQERREEPNTALTFWPLQTLLVARHFGCADLDPSIERGFDWLKSVSDRSGRVGYRRAGEYPEGGGGLAAMASFCASLAGERAPIPEGLRRSWQDRFQLLAAQKREMPRGYYGEFLCLTAASSSGLSARFQESRLGLIGSQARRGEHTGSWEPSDRWGSIGGRVYSTATATLALQADRRVARLLLSAR